MKLEAYIRERDMSVAEFAHSIGRHHSVIYRIINGETEPSFTLRAAIVRATNGKVGELDLIKRVTVEAGEAA